MNKNLLEILEKKGYSKIKKIDEGGFASVFKFKVQKERNDIDLKKDSIVSIKIIDNRNRDNEEKHFLTRELEIDQAFIDSYKKCKFKNNLVKIFEIIKLDNYSLIIYEYMDIDLFDYLAQYLYNNKKYYPNKVLIILYIARELIRGLYTVHKLKIIHNDLKPENILINIEGNYPSRICLTDYGCSYFRNDKKDECGTWVYSSPELLKKLYGDEKLDITEKSDIFSMGIILYKIYTIDEHPFDSNIEVQMRVPIQDYEITDIIKEPFIANLILSMLQYNPKNRPSADKILKDIDYYVKNL